MISRIEFKYKKAHLRYDPDSQAWVGYRVDIRSGSKRRRPVFPTRSEAVRFENEVRVARAYARAGLEDPARREIQEKED